MQGAGAALVENWEDLFSRAPCGLLKLDSEYRITAANAYLLELAGRNAEDLAAGVRFYDLLSMAGRIFVQSRLWPELALAGRVEELALDLVRGDGERTPVLLNASQERDPEGKGADILIALTRAVAKRAYEAEVPRARKEAEQAARAKADFLANVSHEIRTPLNGMIAVAAVLEKTALGASQREMVELIQSSGVMLERLLSDVLEISKVEAGGLQLEVRPFDLCDELRGPIDLARIRAGGKGLGFKARFTDRAQGRFDGDAVRLKQILGNLISNAVKFTEAGEVRVDVDLEPSDTGDFLLNMVVEDTGIGFDQETGDTLFQRFQQSDAGITRKYGGTGLGLAICKGLIDAMDGTIQVRSSPGEGSRFHVRIPLTLSGSAVAHEAPPESIGGPDRPLRILLVEDHPTNQKVVELILAPLGVQLVFAENGQTGVEAWRAGAFDLVLMDMQMPVMDGLTATRTIRSLEAADPRRPRTPIAMLSANAMNHHRDESLACGADLHIAKPVTPASLLEGIRGALAASAAAEAA
jgi:signal transduction histidine kinase/CheY-like chemotaxis protein